MARYPDKYQIKDSDKSILEAWLRCPSTIQSLALRAKIILKSAEGWSPEEVSSQLGISLRTVYIWRKRFKDNGHESLNDRPRPGQPTKISAETVKEVLRLTVERLPRGETHWSIRSMAKYAGISTWQVRQIWKSADLRPHRLKSFKISNDPNFAEKVIDIVGLYMNPPDNALVLSVDEKTQIQALERTQPMLQLKPGQIERRTHDYKRHGITNLYAAFDILTGEVTGRITKRHRSQEFLDFLRQVEKLTPKNMELHIILDNSSTHKTEAVNTWLAAHPRIHTHFTPTSASWLNAVESWFSILERKAIRRGAFTSVEDLKKANNTLSTRITASQPNRSNGQGRLISYCRPSKRPKTHIIFNDRTNRTEH